MPAPDDSEFGFSGEHLEIDRLVKLVEAIS
jgi:hypothetical protein